MNVTKKVALAAAALAVIGALVARLPISGGSRPNISETMYIRGAIVQQDSDPSKQLPISDVNVSADNNAAVSGTSSDSSGFFSLSLRPASSPALPFVLKFRQFRFQAARFEGGCGRRNLRCSYGADSPSKLKAAVLK